MDWTEFVAITATASTIAGSIGGGIAVLLRWRERPEPDWIVSLIRKGLTPGDRGNTEQALKLQIMNGGDGAAFQVRISGEHCTSLTFDNDSEIVDDRTRALMPPGMSLILWAVARIEDVDKVTLTLHWVNPPTRLRRGGELTFTAHEVIAAPVMMTRRRWWQRLG